MKYDLVKNRLEKLLGDSPFLRKLFFAAMDRLFLRSRYVAREIAMLKRSGFAPQQILDAGSGFGQYSFRMARIFPKARITGLDVKEEIVASGNRLAQRSGVENISFKTGDLLDLGYLGQFDLALSVDVLEHIEDDRAVIGNISKALKPGGFFIFTTPYFDGVNPGGAVFIDEHVRPGYSRDETEEKLFEAGLRLKKFTITYGYWGNIAWNLLQKIPMRLLSGRFWLLPVVFIYFIVVYPLAWICMKLDMISDNRSGGGILAVTEKI